jgi:hypothetical protein
MRAVEDRIEAMGVCPPPPPPRNAGGYAQPTKPANPTPPSQREKREMVWQCSFCKSATPVTEYKCRNCGAPR